MSVSWASRWDTRSTLPRQAVSSPSKACRARSTAAGVGPYELFPPPALLGHQAGPFQYRDVLVHRGETHRAGLGEP
ncbi:hypothetical protein SHO565_73080 [Streptomyces sp. HO565]